MGSNLRRRTIDAEPEQSLSDIPLTPTRRRRVALATLRHVRTEMARVYRSMANGELPAQQATRQVYVLAELCKVISITDLERRLLALEQSTEVELLPTMGETVGTVLSTVELGNNDYVVIDGTS